MTVENTTENRGYQLPHQDNLLEVDVGRLIAALQAVDVDIATILGALAGKADTGHGHVLADITGLAAALAAKQDVNEKGQANGYATLGADGKVPTTQLPAALFGAMSYQGTWNANTNTPTIPAASAANKGHYYKVATAGTTNVGGESDWKVGDWIVSNGTGWDKIDNTDQVASVAGLTGVITAIALRAALGLGNAALLDVGTTAGTVAAGDDGRIVGAFQSANVVDEDDMASDSNTKVPTQQSVKAYVDNEISSIDLSDKAGFYTGSTGNETNLPVGHIVILHASDGGYSANAVVDVWVDRTTVGNLWYYRVGSGSGGNTAKVSGTWRLRGRADNGTNISLAQRVA